MVDQISETSAQMTLFSEPKPKGQLTYSSREVPASHSASQGGDLDWMTHAATWRSSPLEFLNDLSPDGLFLRTSLAFSQVTKGETFGSSKIPWKNAGIRSRGVSSTLNLPEWHSDAAVCLLSDILETGDHLRRYCLSAKACAGILRRADKRGKKLPEMLEAALLATADLTPEQVKAMPAGKKDGPPKPAAP